MTIPFIAYQLYIFHFMKIAGGQPFGLAIWLGFMEYVALGIYAILILSTIVYAIWKVRQEKWKAFLPLIICLGVVLVFFIVPFLTMYVRQI